MQTAELKAFEKMEEGVALFNDDGTFDYINEAGADLLWSHNNDDSLYGELEDIVSSLISNVQHRPNEKILKNAADDCDIKCSVSMVNGHILVVLVKSFDGELCNSRYGSALDMIRNKLYVMSSVYVGGRPVLNQDVI